MKLPRGSKLMLAVFLLLANVMPFVAACHDGYEDGSRPLRLALCLACSNVIAMSAWCTGTLLSLKEE